MSLAPLYKKCNGLIVRVTEGRRDSSDNGGSVCANSFTQSRDYPPAACAHDFGYLHASAAV